MQHLPVLVEDFDGPKALKHEQLNIEKPEKRENENPNAPTIQNGITNACGVSVNGL